jgi:C-terminal processing protease CtpA/Prc
MAADVRARLARGEYDAVTDGTTYARLLTEHFRGVSKDRHLRVEYSASGTANRRLVASPDPDSRQSRRADMLRRNCGFVKVELLPGNVGYVKLNFFGDPEVCASTATAAMSFIAHADALIIDLRDNGGGTPAMVAYVSSYLFDQRTHLNDIWERRANRTDEFWTRDVPGPKFGGQRPVFVLTSSRTFSGAEEFSYNLKNLERATIVGERTGGGAHPVRGHDLGDSFTIGVPFARAINPITKTNWEGTGVTPDVDVPAADALEVARKMIGQVKPTP